MEELSSQSRGKLKLSSNSNLVAPFQKDAAEQLSEENCSFDVNVFCSELNVAASHMHTNLLSTVIHSYEHDGDS